MSKTDKTRPYRVKMLDSTSNYTEHHNHASRPKRDKDGNYVYRLTGKVWPHNGEPQRVVVYEDATECDLPPSPDWHVDPDWRGCYYTAKREWEVSGQARCGCKRCTQQDERRFERKRDRRKAKIAARIEARDVATAGYDEDVLVVERLSFWQTPECAE